MHRIIFNLGGLSITSWGVMVVIAFIVAIWVAEKRAKKYGLSPSIMPDLSLVLIIAGIVGGRVVFVLENLSYYAQYPGEILKVWEGGLVFYGGFGLAILCGIIFLKKRKVKIPRVMDVVAPSVALGLFFARIGCFLNGCCFGKPTTLPWGIKFPANSPAGWAFKEAVPLHPTQIYSSLAGLCIFGILLMFEKRKKFVPRIRDPDSIGNGHLFWMLLFLYSSFRFAIDFIRYYDQKVYLLWGLTYNQLVSLTILILLFSIPVCRQARKVKRVFGEPFRKK